MCAGDVIEGRLRRRVRAAEVIKPTQVLGRGYRVTTGDLTMAVKEDEGTAARWHGGCGVSLGEEKMGVRRDEILAMKPGRELDVLVAEKVMGNAYEEYGFRYPDHLATKGGEESWGNSPEYTIAKCRNYGGTLLKRLAAPEPYSQEIAAAWEVVERLLMRGEKLSIYCDPDAPGPDLVESDRFTVAWPVGDNVSARTAPEAICKAAIITLEGTNG